MSADSPIIANNKPQKVTLEKGKTYYFCTCGRSQNQPFCDGSHKGSSFSSQKFVAQETEAYLCQCKCSSKLPYCDGTHKSLANDAVGQSVDSCCKKSDM